MNAPAINIDALQVQHAPGPWSIGQQYKFGTRDYTPIVDSLGSEVAAIRKGAHWGEGRELPPHNLANARLIASAPELLEMLDSCAGTLQVFVDDGSAHQDSVIGKNAAQARALIARITGSAA